MIFMYLEVKMRYNNKKSNCILCGILYESGKNLHLDV